MSMIELSEQRVGSDSDAHSTSEYIACECCGFETMPNDIYAMCETCGWEDDHPKPDPDIGSGINAPFSLNEARRLFRERGWIFGGTFAWIKHGCPPSEDGPAYEFVRCPCCGRMTMEISNRDTCFTCEWTVVALIDHEPSNVLHGETDAPIGLTEARRLLQTRGWVFTDSYLWELHGCPEPCHHSETPQ